MKIISFFSFKGGVGRTSLLLNVGAYWASKGKVVALIDLDLFAPGLTYNHMKGRALFPQGAGWGMSDILYAYYNIRDEKKKNKKEKKKNEIPFLPPHLLLKEMNLPREKLEEKTGRLLLIDAGEKASELTTLDRESNPQRELTPEHSLPVIKSPLEDEGESSSEAAFRSFAEYFREDLENAKIPPLESDGEEQSIDYVLIDSRTGFPELLDLSLGYLGDKMVLVSGLNDQNLIGLQETFKALNKRVPVDTLPAYLTVVISPIPAAEDDALFDRLKIVHERIEQSMRLTQSGMPELSPTVRYIHYTPVLSMSEAALAVERPESTYAQEVASIADELEWSPEETEGRYVFRFHEEYAFAARARDEVRSKVLELTTEAQTSGEVGIPTDVPSETQRLLKSNPLAQLPSWFWPLPNLEDRLSKLEEIMPPNEADNRDREIVLNKLYPSLSTSIDDKEKILKIYPERTGLQITRLIKMLDFERRVLMQIWFAEPKSRFRFLQSFIKSQRDWAEFITGNVALANHAFLEKPFQEEGAFAEWEKEPGYWILLARYHFEVYQQEERVIEAIDRAFDHPEEDSIVSTLRQIFDVLDASAMGEHLRERIETKGRLRLNKLVDRIKAGQVENAELCYQAGVFIMTHAQKLISDCEAVLRRAIRLDLKYALPWNELGNLLQKHLERFEEGENAYRKAIELDSKYALPWNGLGSLLGDHLERFEEAEDAFRKAIELDPKEASPWNNLGLLLKNHLGRFEEAEDTYRKAIELDPKDAVPWYNLGILLEDLSRFEEAEDAYRKAIELNPKYALPWYNLGHLFLRNLGRFGDAENAYWKAIELDSKDTSPWNTLGVLRRDFQKDRARARLYFEEGLEIDSNDAYLLMNLGWLFKAEGDAAKSEDRLRRSLESFIEKINQKKVSDDRLLAYALDLVLQLKDAENAQKCFELASHRASHFWASPKLLGALFCYHLVHQDAEKAEAWLGVKTSLKGFFEMFEQIQQLYNLAGFRPEVVEEARNLVGELLDAPPELTERFKDVRIADEFLVAYRRFAEGKSRGLGDPGDLQYLFNRPKQASTVL